VLLAPFRLLGRLPLSWLHRAGTVLGWLVYRSSSVYAGRLRRNLFESGLCGDEAACRTLLRTAIGEAGKSVTELLAVWFGTDERVARLVVECERWDLVEAARRRGKGIIFLTPHLGCFEISALYGARRMPLTVLYRPPKLRWLGPLMTAGRSRWKATLAPASLRGVRLLYRALARGEAVGLLPDQAPSAGEGVWAEFFGRPAFTMTLAKRLQEASGAATIMVFAERLPAGRGYRLHIEELPVEALDETRLNRAIEAQVRKCPEQYLWSYNRYKIPGGAVAPFPGMGEARRKAEGQ
jgi:KDO2-lipid IV(A) lauroyltransferase